MSARLPWSFVVLCCVLAPFFGSCRKAAESPAPPPEPAQTAAVLDGLKPPAAGQLPPRLRERIAHYKGRMNRGLYAEGIAGIREALPELERYVEENPTAPEGQVELAGAYAVWMFVAAKMPPGQEATLALVEGVEKDYVGRAVRALDAFEKHSDPNDRRRRAAAEVRKLLDDIRSRALSGRGTADCSDNVLRQCRRIESGEAPATVFGTVKVNEIIDKVEGCMACGSFPRIESKVLPAAKKMRELLDQLAKERQ